MSTLVAFVSDNAIVADPKEREASLREKVPDLLLQDETIVFAFKDRGGKGRDSSNLTSKRILIKDKRGLTGKKTDYISIPYSAIKAYSVETAGSLDSDCELKIYASGFGKLKLDLIAGVDIFAIYRFLNSVILVGSAIGMDAPSGAVPTSAEAFSSSGGRMSGFLDLLGGDSSQIDAATVESQLKAPDVNILLPDETVEMAFKCGRDSFLLTTHRILRIDVQGMSGRSVEYYTLLWKSVRAFSIETAGSFLDRDTELLLYTSVPDAESCIEGMPRKNRTRFAIDFRKGGADLFAVQRFFSDKLLGPDPVAPSSHAISNAGIVDSGSGNPFAWLGNDSRMIDAEEMDRRYHSDPAILQSNEHVEMAFKGRRDIMLFTTKRVIFVDLKGWSGHKIEYTSLPWSSVQLFGVRSAGSMLDKDSEVMFWPDFDDCFFPPRQGEDSPPPPPIPRKSFIECDFQKDKVDILTVHRYLSERCLRTEGGHIGNDGIFVPDHMASDERVSPDVLIPAPAGTLSKFKEMITSDARAIDPKQLDATMHGSAPILQLDEQVQMAYKAGRDTFIVTNKRLFLIDTQGFSGKRVAYISIPFTSIRAFAVESAGSWDSDAEVKIWTKTYWKVDGGIGNKWAQDLRKSKADIIQLQSYLAAQIIGSTDPSTSLQPGATAPEAGSVATFLSYINNDGVAQDPMGVEAQLRSSPPILQQDESVDACYKMGRDMCIFTTKRILVVDVQGMTGKRVEYRTFPLRYITCFTISTAGSFMSAAEATIYSDGSKHVTQDLSKSSSDVWQVQTIIANKALNK